MNVGLNTVTQSREAPTTAGNFAKSEGPSQDHAMRGKTSGNGSVRTTGNVSITPGMNAAATTDTAFLTIASVRILAVVTGFASTMCPSS